MTERISVENSSSNNYYGEDLSVKGAGRSMWAMPISAKMRISMRSAVIRISSLTLFAVAFFSPMCAVAADWDHIHLNVDDTKAGAAWYAKHLGGKVTKAGDFDAVLFGDKLIKMRKLEGGLGGGVGSPIDHIAFSVQDVDGKLAELRDAGLTVKTGGRMGRKNRSGEGRSQTTGRLTDPWGTKIELLHDEEVMGFHHVHLKSQTSATVAEWYAKASGGEVSNFKDAPAIRAIRFGDVYIFMQRTIRAPLLEDEPPVDHIAWQSSDFTADVARLKAMGVRFTMEPVKVGDHRIAFLEGPDGVKIELVEAVSE